MADKFGQVLVPVEEVVEMKSGQKAISERHFFPGYILVADGHDRRDLAPGEEHAEGDRLHRRHGDAAHADLRQGSREHPAPGAGGRGEAASPRCCSRWARTVRVTDGPFTDFNGNVEDVNYEKSKIRVSVPIFGRSTPVELDFGQVEKA